MNFSQQNETTLRTFLKGASTSQELEIRFGNFVYDKVSQNKHFESDVEIDYFYRCKKFLNNIYEENDGKYSKVNTTEYSYPIAGGSIRRIINNDTNVETIMKKISTKRPYNIFDYNIRLSEASETMQNKKNTNMNWDEYKFVRIKNRDSFIFSFGRFDLTIVNQGIDENKTTKPKYEIEFEVYMNDYDLVLDFILVLMQLKQENFNVISSYDEYGIIKQYKQLVKQDRSAYFIGVQPETLQKDQLTLLFKELYSVTDKADGDRFFLFIDRVGNVYFLDSNINNVLKTDLKSNSYTNCLIDGELIRNYDKDDTLISISFYAFDVLFINNIDIRESVDYLFNERLVNLTKIVESIKLTENYSVFVKKFIYRNVFMGAEIIMKDIHNKPYHNDGLIFTPINEPYPKRKQWKKLLKWKPADQNTIDFLSIKNEKGDWDLYVQHTPTYTPTYNPINDNNLTKNKLQLVKFDINELCPNKNETDITFKTTFDETLLDPTTKEPYKSGTVIEYKWDLIDKKFVPLRTRWDKTSNPTKQGNFSSVACSIWYNIKNPVDPETIYQMTNNTTEHTNKSFFFERLVNFHNKINMYLSNKYVSDCKTLLEINFNKGDNIEIYKNNVTQLYGIEFNKSNLSNVIKKAKQLKIQNYLFLEIPFDNQISKNTKNFYKNCDTILSTNMSNFFESENSLLQLIDLLNCSLTNSGKFIISFIDSNQIKSKLFINNNEILYNITQSPIQSTNFSKYTIFINGMTNENNTVNIVNYTYFINFMLQHGYTLIESELYKTLFEMSSKLSLIDYEKDISFLYRFCVFESTSTKTQVNPITPIAITQVTLPLPIKQRTELYTQYNKIDLKLNKDVHLYKLECCLDILDILNCVEYTYNKNSFKDTLINWENIKELVEKINYTPILFNTLTLNSEISVTGKFLVFYNYNYENEDTTIIENMYIAFYCNQIHFNINNLTNSLEQKVKDVVVKDIIVKDIIVKDIIVNDIVAKDVVINDIVVNDIVVNDIVVKNVVEPIEQLTKLIENIDIKNKNTSAIEKKYNECKKVTMAILKEFLKELNLKTTGSKQELIERLVNEFKN